MAEIPFEAQETAARALAAELSCANWAPSEYEMVGLVEAGELAEDFDAALHNEAVEKNIAGAILTAAAPYLIAEGRRQVIAELRQLATPAGPLFTPLQIVMLLEGRASVESLALRDYQPDDRDRLMARYERELRAKIAGEIRAANTDNWPGGRNYEVRGCQEQAARIAEGSDGD